MQNNSTNHSAPVHPGESVHRPDPMVRRRFLWSASIVWVLVVSASFIWNWIHIDRMADQLATQSARTAFEKDVIYRRWSAMHGGVYVPPTAQTPPNPHLKDLPYRDVVTTTGIELTLVNPAYMTRQVHELGLKEDNVQGHITSLKPIREQNAPDPWEAEALQSFQQGKDEAASVETMNGEPHLRLMRPLITEAGCMQCHAAQGYEIGDIRGGISVSVPLSPYLAAARDSQTKLGFAHGVIGALGLLGLVGAGNRLRRSEEHLTAKVVELGQALDQIKTLRGIMPICANCKKIRNDSGYWQQVEHYLLDHSDAEFSHSICPDCAHLLYPDLDLSDVEEGDGTPT